MNSVPPYGGSPLRRINFEVDWQTARWLEENRQWHSWVISPQEHSTNHTVVVQPEGKDPATRLLYAGIPKAEPRSAPELSAVSSRRGTPKGPEHCSLKPH